MRTAIIILAGFLLWGVCLGVARLLRTSGRAGPAATRIATTAFIGAWFIAAGINLWMGVTRAGYTVEEELPIFLLIFLVPSIAAALVRWLALNGRGSSADS